jgi:hypothetical protein
MPTGQVQDITRPDQLTACGARRRLEALARIGYSSTDLAELLNLDVGHFADGFADVPPYKWGAVDALFGRLELVEGRSRHAREEAIRRGYAGPLAWDEDTIDDPDAEPQGVEPRGYRRINRTPPDFAEMVAEHRSLGRFDEDIAERMGLTLRTFQKRLHRAGLPQRSRGLDGGVHAARVATYCTRSDRQAS